MSGASGPFARSCNWITSSPGAPTAGAVLVKEPGETVRLHDTRAGKPCGKPVPYTAKNTPIALSPNGRTVLIADGGKTAGTVGRRHRRGHRQAAVACRCSHERRLPGRRPYRRNAGRLARAEDRRPPVALERGVGRIPGLSETPNGRHFGNRGEPRWPHSADEPDGVAQQRVEHGRGNRQTDRQVDDAPWHRNRRAVQPRQSNGPDDRRPVGQLGRSAALEGCHGRPQPASPFSTPAAYAASFARTARWS